MRVSRRTQCYQFLLLFVSVVFVLVFSEILLRVYYDVVKSPVYRVLYKVPDPKVGWKNVPNMHFTWTGGKINCVDYNTEIKINEHGFRDYPRTIEKPTDTIRIALLGDSMVEAVQVPLELTAAQLLENKLNAGNNHSIKYQVLNFGIASFSVGQYFLMYKEYALEFSPDYIFIFVAPFQMLRTIKPVVRAGVAGTNLKINPQFLIKDGELIHLQGEDYPTFSRIQDQTIKYWAGGSRIKRLYYVNHPVYEHIPRDAFRDKRLLQHLLEKKVCEVDYSNPDYLFFADTDEDKLKERIKELDMGDREIIMAMWRQSVGKLSFLRSPIKWIRGKSYLFKQLLPLRQIYRDIYRFIENDDKYKKPVKMLAEDELNYMLEINHRTIAELNKMATGRGSRLVFVDASSYFFYLRFLLNDPFFFGARIHDSDHDKVIRENKKFCTTNNIDYIDLGKYLLKGIDKGIEPYWRCDKHFNEAGNMIFCESMYEWMLQNVIKQDTNNEI